MLTQKDLSYFQQWALLYWVCMDHRTRAEERRFDLIQQTYNLFPERFDELYREEVLRDLGIYPEEELPVTEDDLDALDQFLAQQEQHNLKRWIGADQLGLPPDWQPDKVGRRV